MRLPTIILISALLLCWATLGHALDSNKITINGYTSFEVEKQVDGQGKGGGDPHLSFDADLFDLVVNFQVSDQVRAAADFTWEHGVASEDDRGNAALEYGFVEHTFSDLFKIRVGKMFTPFGIFNEIHTAKTAFLSVKEAASTNKPERIVEGAFRFFPRWGVGIALRGDGIIAGRFFSYDLLFANGEQEDTNPFEEDDNLGKSVTARFLYEPTDNLRIGNSLYYDKLGEPGFDFLFSEGLELEFHWRQLRVLAEGVWGFKGPNTGSTIRQFGFFVQPSYQLSSQLVSYLRIGHIDPNADLDEDGGFNLVVGIN